MDPQRLAALRASIPQRPSSHTVQRPQLPPATLRPLSALPAAGGFEAAALVLEGMSEDPCPLVAAIDSAVGAWACPAYAARIGAMGGVRLGGIDEGALQKALAAISSHRFAIIVVPSYLPEAMGSRHAEALETALLDAAKEGGATIVFAAIADANAAPQFVARLELAWTAAPATRAQCRRLEGDAAQSCAPSSLSTFEEDTVPLAGVAEEHRAFVQASEDSHTCIAAAPVGSGIIAYIGDVKISEPTLSVLAKLVEGAVRQTPNAKEGGYECAHCAERGWGHSMCSACKAVRYCGSGCQRAHRKRHKTICGFAVAARAAQRSSEGIVEREEPAKS